MREEDNEGAVTRERIGSPRIDAETEDGYAG